MTITYTWTIESLETAPQENNLQDVVKTVHWRYQATDGTFTVDRYGSEPMDNPVPENFVQFNNLTKNMVVSWLESKLNVEEMNTSFQNQINKLHNPPIVSKSVPWNS